MYAEVGGRSSDISFQSCRHGMLGGSTVQDNKNRIRAFVSENFLFGEDSDIGDDTSLLEQGIIDSTSILEIVAFLEEEFDVEVADEELIPENFDSISALTAFLERKSAAAA